MEMNKEFIFRKSYCHFSFGDKGRVVEIIQCGCCKIPLVLCKVVDVKESKHVWVSSFVLDNLVDYL